MRVLCIFALSVLETVGNAAQTKQTSTRDLSIKSDFGILSKQDKQREKEIQKASIKFLNRLTQAKRNFRYSYSIIPTPKLKTSLKRCYDNYSNQWLYKRVTESIENTQANLSQVMQSVFVIKGSNGSGSGFFTSLWGVPVGITNAHVYADMEAPVVLDGSGVTRNIKSSLILKDRDIVIMELDNADGINPLPIQYQAARVPLKLKVYAYGNSLGDGVITKEQGNLQGIGPLKIEMDAGIVPGNSGGPVILSCNGKVIGVSTYIKRSSGLDWYLKGSKYSRHSNSDKDIVRRFAYRIDNIDLNKCEILNMVTRAKDIKAIEALRTANAYASKTLKENDFTTLVNTMSDKYYALQFNPNEYQCGSQFLQDKYSKQLNFFRILSILLEIEEVFPSKNETLQNNFKEIMSNLSKKRIKPVRCKPCKGRGYIIERFDKYGRPYKPVKTNPAMRRYEQSSCNNRVLEPQTHSKYIKCERCNGTGWYSKSKYFYTLNKDFDITNKIKCSNIDYMGFVPGVGKKNCNDPVRGLKFDSKAVYDIVEAYYFKGNKRFSRARETQLSFVLGRLQKVKVLFDYTPQLYQKLKSDLIQKYGNPKWEVNKVYDTCCFVGKDYWIKLQAVKNGKDKYIFTSCKHPELSVMRFLFTRTNNNTLNRNKYLSSKTDSGF
jgi:S1-C subfamily serine protease